MRRGDNRQCEAISYNTPMARLPTSVGQRAATYASTSASASTPENIAGTGKMKRHAMTVPTVASAMTAMIGLRRTGSDFATDASCHNRMLSISMNTLIDQPTARLQIENWIAR